MGYAAPYRWPVFVAVLASSLYLNEFYVGIPHFWVVLCLIGCFALHEGLRSFSPGFLGVGVLVVAIVANVGREARALANRGFQPKFPEWSAWFHLLHAAVTAIGATYGHTVVWLHNAQSIRRNADLFGRVQGWISCFVHGVALETFTFNGLEHLWLRSAADATPLRHQNAKRTKQTLVVLYFHGGGYTILSPRVYIDFCNRLAHQIRTQLEATSKCEYSVEVCVAKYRKLPEVLFPVPVDDTLAMYEYLTGRERSIPAHNIVLAGDSAGAGLVLATMMRLRDAGKALPLLGICSSPYVDLSGGEAFSEHCIVRAPIPDCIREFSIASASQDPSSLREAHIVECDLSNLPPLLIQTGAFDLFHQHALRLAKKAKADGVACEVDVHANMPHVFTVFPKFLLPGSEKGIVQMAAFVVKNLHHEARRARQF